MLSMEVPINLSNRSLNRDNIVKSSPLDGLTKYYNTKNKQNNNISSNMFANSADDNDSGDNHNEEEEEEEEEKETIYSQSLVSNNSILSFGSISTNERLLDKLDLSPEDELLLQQVLSDENKQQFSINNDQMTYSNNIQGENNNSRNNTNSLQNPKKISMPASQFPSLRYKHINNSKTNSANVVNKKQTYHDQFSNLKADHFGNSIRNILEKDVTFRDKTLTAKVEQHYANTSRYSYIVEEDNNEDEDEYENNGFNLNEDRNNFLVENNIPYDKRFQNFVAKSYQSNKLINNNNNKRNLIQEQLTNNYNQSYPNHEKIANVSNNNPSFLNNNHPTSSNNNLFYQFKHNNINYKSKKYNHNNSLNFERFRYENPIYPSQVGNRYGNNLNKQKLNQPSLFINNNTNKNNTIPCNIKNNTLNKTYSNNKHNSIENSSSITNKNEYKTSNTKKNMNPSSTPNSNHTIIRNELNYSPSIKPLYNHTTPKHIYRANAFDNEQCDKNSRSQSTTPIKRNESSASGTSKNTEFSNNILQLSHPVTQSSLDTEISPISTISVSPQRNTINQLTPSRQRAWSPMSKTTYLDEINEQPTPPFKSHKKKSSLSSFKNLFRTPKNKDKTKEIKTGDVNSLELSQSKSTERSPSQFSANMSNLIFNPQPNFHSDITPNQKGNVAIDRGLNDSSINHGNVRGNESSDIVKGNKPLNQRSQSEFENPITTTSISTDMHGRNRSIQAMDSSHYKKLSPKINKTKISSTSHAPPEFDSLSNEDNAILNNNLITSAIDMRNEGRLELSAAKLKKACLSGNRTAFLLYGLALRNGYGIKIDYNESFKYIRMATNILDFNNEVFNFQVSPFDIERNLDILPVSIEEPLVPALYECGIAYLKGLGVDRIDEIKGLKCLEKAASLGHVDSMCLSGIIWSQKPNSKQANQREKDIVRAATWFRIAHAKGATLIGSDWIYKKKYTKAAEKRKM